MYYYPNFRPSSLQAPLCKTCDRPRSQKLLFSDAYTKVGRRKNRPLKGRSISPHTATPQHKTPKRFCTASHRATHTTARARRTAHAGGMPHCPCRREQVMPAKKPPRPKNGGPKPPARKPTHDHEMPAPRRSQATAVGRNIGLGTQKPTRRMGAAHALTPPATAGVGDPGIWPYVVDIGALVLTDV